MTTRRRVLLCGGAGIAASLPLRRGARAGSVVRVMPITSGPEQHWFGYYDKNQIDASGRYALGARAPLMFRSPSADDIIHIGVIDLQAGNQWQSIGRSTAWGWQQGCMLQWIPGRGRRAIWNDREDGRLVSRIADLDTGTQRTIDAPVYTLSPDGRSALTVDLLRLQDLRPGYGVAAETPISEMARAPDDDGIWRIDLDTGERTLILTLAQLRAVPRPEGAVRDNYHWINHLLVDPTGERFIFLNRSRGYRITDEMKQEPRWVGKYLSAKHTTRVFTARMDGSDLYLLNDTGYFSHFAWRDESHIAAWSEASGYEERAFYLLEDKTQSAVPIDRDRMPVNGHNTYVPNTNNEWILNDTYARGPGRLQMLYLYHVPTRRRIVLGEFHSPSAFKGEWRCDLHPRCDQQGRRVFFDSVHIGDRRQMYSVDISSIVGKI